MFMYQVIFSIADLGEKVKESYKIIVRGVHEYIESKLIGRLN